jgi:hypothetical protein
MGVSVGINGRIRSLHPRCRRIFNGGSFKLGGRFYGSHQSLKKDERKTITIDGESTVELDFKCLHPTMLYHQIGKQPPSDCYSIFGDNRDAVIRPIAKSVLLIGLNAKDKIGTVRALHEKWFHKPKSIPKGFNSIREVLDRCNVANFADLIDLFQKRHAPIAHYFCSGEGIRLQYLDSEIMSLILSNCVAEGIPALPVHDSIVVPEQYSARAEAIMHDAYMKEIGHKITVERKV